MYLEPKLNKMSPFLWSLSTLKVQILLELLLKDVNALQEKSTGFRFLGLHFNTFKYGISSSVEFSIT